MNTNNYLVEAMISFFNSIFNKKLVGQDDIDDVLSTIENDEKEGFFILYQNIKNGIIKPEDLMISDLIKVQQMMAAESEVLDNKIQEEEAVILEQENTISNYKKEYEKLQVMLNNKKHS